MKPVFPNFNFLNYLILRKACKLINKQTFKFSLRLSGSIQFECKLRPRLMSANKLNKILNIYNSNCETKQRNQCKRCKVSS